MSNQITTLFNEEKYEKWSWIKTMNVDFALTKSKSKHVNISKYLGVYLNRSLIYKKTTVIGQKFKT